MKKNSKEPISPNFLYISRKEKEKPLAGESSRISIPLTKAIASDRDPSFFDTEEVTERDKQLLEELERRDTQLNLHRNNKPVDLSPSEAQLVHALAFGIGTDLNSEDVKEIIENPFSEKEVIRNVDLNALSKFLNARTSERDRQALRDRFYRLDTLFHVTPIEVEDKRGRKRQYRHIMPLIRIKQELEASADGEREGNNAIRVGFGRVFFVMIQKRYAILTPKLFEVWRTGKKTELFHVLLDTLLSIYWQCYVAAQKMEKRLEKENNSLPKEERLSPEALQEKINEDKKGAYTYELNFSSIKKKVTADYESKRQYRAKFKKDLEKVISDLKEVGLLTDETIITKGTQGEKVVFRLNEDYYTYPKTEIETQSKLFLPPTEK